MLSRPHVWSLVCVTAFGIIASGCRGSYPLARSVQVTKDPAIPLPEIDAPPQRLATAKPRVGSEFGDQTIATVGHLDDSPHVSRMVSSPEQAQADDDPSSAGVTTAGGSEATRRAPQPGAPKTGPTASATNPKASLTAAPASKSTGTGTPSDVATAKLPFDASEMLDAFKNSPPAIQQQALRQLMAAAARTAEASTQPQSIEDAIMASLSDVPELPPKSSTPSDIQPKRLGVAAEEDGEEGVDRSLSDVQVETVAAVDNEDRSSHSVAQVSATTAREPNALPDMKRDETLADAVKPSSDAIASASPAPTLAPDPKPAATPSLEPSKTDVASLSDQQLFEALVARFGKAVEGENESERTRRLISLRHLMVLSGRPDEAVSEVDGLPENEREFLRHQLLGLWTIIDPDGHPVQARRFSAALPQFRQAVTQLAAATDALDVRSLAFCTEIESYGQIKKFPSTRFKPGQQVILYCEVENFVANSVSGGYETQLQGSYDIVNEAGEKIASQLLPADRQVANNYLRDYFIAYQMRLPAEIAAGKYRLQLTMEDLNGKKYGQAVIDLEIGR